MRVTSVNYGDGTRGRAFDCPGCGTAHAVPVTGPKAWGFNGDDARPTFSPSILVNRGRLNPSVPQCHFYVENGRIRFLADCSHALAGKTVDLPEIERGTSP